MFGEALKSAMDLNVLLLTALGSLSGVLIGALPGLSVTMATALLVSLTFSWSMEYAMAMIIGVYCGGVFGGSISAVLLNIPGAPGAICTGFDGYPLARQGKAAMALGLARIGSFIGGLIGVFFLAAFAPPISVIALKFGPFEYLGLITLGLITIGNLSEGSFLKAILAGLFGLLLSTVGMDPVYGIPRFTFGSMNLLSGIGLIPSLIGFFGLSEVIVQMRTPSHQHKAIDQLGKVLPKLKTFLKMIPLIIRSSILGAWIGALPGVGGTIASFLAYDSAKKTVKHPSAPFGEGAYEGVVAPEVANNAMIGGAMIPLLTLGIPGDAVTAVMMGAFIVHGMQPGPLMMVNSQNFFWFIIILLVLANFLFLFLGLLVTKYFPKVLSVRPETLMPIVSVLCFVGAYAIRNSVFDIVIMVVAGLVGYFFKLIKFPVGPVVIGLVLGGMADGEMRRVSMISEGDILGMLFSRPIALVIFAFALLQILDQVPGFRSGRKKMVNRVFSLFRQRKKNEKPN
ncbi:MAG: tripartite tricarboxylate transporter permease [Spirochaetales bacterium]|nr:tripartite tricarboxylate transporter permease [Spirochaetales bacterium]